MKTFLKAIYRHLRILQRVGLASYLRYQVTSKGALVTIPIAGHDIRVRRGTPDLSVALSCLHGEFDLVKHLFPADFDGTIVDAGGYIGTATLALKGLFPQAKIIVIEPSEDNLSVLRENLAGTTGVEIVHGALVGTPEKTIELHNRGTGEWGFTVVSDPHDNPNTSALNSTPAYRLSDLKPEGETIGLLKLDIEGGEYSLLENDMASLLDIDVVFAELHDRIVPGCEKKYLDFSKDRILIKDGGEKYLSIKR